VRVPAEGDEVATEGIRAGIGAPGGRSLVRRREERLERDRRAARAAAELSCGGAEQSGRRHVT
jgi:hypothetical protein